METENIPNQNPVEEPKKMPKRQAILSSLLILSVLTAGSYYLKLKYNEAHAPISPPTPISNPKTPESSVVPTIIPFEQTVAGPVVDATVNWHYPIKTYLDLGDPNVLSGSKFYELGTFKNGPYDGNRIYTVMLSVPCYYCLGDVSNGVIRIAENKNGKAFMIIKRNSDLLDNFSFYSDSTQPPLDASKVGVDTNLNLVELEQPKTLGTSSGQALIAQQPSFFQGSYNIFNATNLKYMFTDTKLGSVYTTPDDPKKVDNFYSNFGFYVQAPDWNTWIYSFKPEFIGDNYSVAQIVWNGGTINKTVYVYQERTGCGTSNYADVVSGLNIQKDLVQSGITNSGDKVYELKDKNSSILKDIYDNQYYPPYDNQTNQPGTKIPYDQFVSQHPLFFWVDPFGRLIKFSNNDFQPQAECGKPVIYLYPQQTEKVTVKLSPTGGFSYTEPDYANGWNVLAQPSGELTNLSDGKNYPYLFWEGRSRDIYQIPSKGFVVARDNVNSFLEEKLAKLGLNQKETGDFEAYWEPYMQSSPYYFVTFMGNQVADKIAPLEITPNPDTVIRILMDFEPLSQPIPVQGYDIKTPIRRGFTVVEWGGVKH